MKFLQHQLQHLAACVATFAFVSGSAAAQTYPARQITMIVAFPAGGPTSAIARVVAERMQAFLGQPVIIDNIGGAGGSIGVGKIARAAPDGYTLSFGSVTTHVYNGAVYALSYDVQKDFEPVSLVATNPLLIGARKDMPAKDLKELIAWLKSNPDKATQWTAGLGTTQHLAGTFLQKETGTRFQFIPYRGGPAAWQDVLAGRIDLSIDLAATALPLVQAGTIKGYAVTAKARLAVSPEIPTVDEAGLPGFYMSAWQAIFAPKGTAKAIIGKLNAAVVDALADPVVRSRLAAIGQEIPPRDQQTPEALAAYQKAEIEKWWPIIKAAGIKAE
jgi:tripartite-type tricarboxylate transporter receptor subunit TctC